MRARLLLLQQDKIAQLEDQLDEIDRTETRLLYLGKARCDRNADRSHIVSEIGSHLADYGSITQVSVSMLSLKFYRLAVGKHVQDTPL